MSSHNYGEHEEEHLARYYMSQGLPTASDGRVGASNQGTNDDQHSTRRTAAADGLQAMSMLPVDSSPTTLYPPGRNQEYDDDEGRRPVGIASNSLNSNTEITMEMVGLSHNTFSDNVQFQIPRFMQDPVGFDPAGMQHHLHPHQQMPKSTATPSAATSYQTVMSSAAMSSGDMFSGLVVARDLNSATSSVPAIDYPSSTGHYHHAYVSTSTGVSNTPFAPFPYSAVPSNSHPYQPSVLPGSESAVSSITAAISQKLPRSSSLALNGLPIYSSSGFDMVDILARVATRPQPKVTLGPVDMSCAFLVTDVTREDSPIIYVSATFSELTGYTEEEIIGKNCRFLQAPPGVNLEKGGEREHTDIDSVTQMAQSVSLNRECQVTLINYRKSGEAFINCVTIIPIIPPGNEPVRYHVGFQVDLAVQPLAIMRSVQSGHYITNYSSSPLPPVMYQPSKPNVKSISKDMADVMNRIGDGSASPMTEGQDRHKLSLKILGESPDSVFIVSLKGSFLYVSPSISKLLKFDADYFLNKNLSDVCHPSDLAPVMRSIKESSTPLGNPNPGSTAPSNQPQTAPGAQDVELMFRARCSDGTYVWLECPGRMHSDTSRGRKALLLRLRKVDMPRITWPMINASGGVSPSDCYIRVARDDRGLVVACLHGVEDVLGKKKEDVIGKTLSELIVDDAKGTKRDAIKSALGISDLVSSVDEPAASRVVFCNMPATIYRRESTTATTRGAAHSRARTVVLATTELTFYPPLTMKTASGAEEPQGSSSPKWWKISPNTMVVKLRILHRRAMRTGAIESTSVTYPSTDTVFKGSSSFVPGLPMSSSIPTSLMHSSSGYGLSTNDLSQLAFPPPMSSPVQLFQQEPLSTGTREIVRKQGFQVPVHGDINLIDDTVMPDDSANTSGTATQPADGPSTSGNQSAVGYSWQYELQQLRMRNAKLREDIASLKQGITSTRKDNARAGPSPTTRAAVSTSVPMAMEHPGTGWPMTVTNPGQQGASAPQSLPFADERRKRTWSQTDMQHDWEQWGS